MLVTSDVPAGYSSWRRASSGDNDDRSEYCNRVACNIRSGLGLQRQHDFHERPVEEWKVRVDASEAGRCACTICAHQPSNSQNLTHSLVYRRRYYLRYGGCMRVYCRSVSWKTFAMQAHKKPFNLQPPFLSHTPNTGNVFPHGLSWDWRTHAAVIGPVQNQGKVRKIKQYCRALS